MAEIAFDTIRPDVVCIDGRLPDVQGSELAAAMVRRGAAVVMLTNDNRCHEQPPAGTRCSLLKSRTTPADLAAAISAVLEPGRERTLTA